VVQWVDTSPGGCQSDAYDKNARSFKQATCKVRFFTYPLLIIIGSEKMARELLFSITKKDFKIETMRGSGNGGQHRNKTDSAVRITHIASGAVGYSEDERHQPQNKKKALERLVKSQKFQVWHKQKCAELMMSDEHKEILKEVEYSMREENLKIEYGV
jgi:protein subunit release factor A